VAADEADAGSDDIVDTTDAATMPATHTAAWRLTVLRTESPSGSWLGQSAATLPSPQIRDERERLQPLRQSGIRDWMSRCVGRPDERIATVI
jgi:hypothetical protein